jgi:hypothetical protein
MAVRTIGLKETNFKKGFAPLKPAIKVSLPAWRMNGKKGGVYTFDIGKIRRGLQKRVSIGAVLPKIRKGTDRNQFFFME